MRVRTITDGCFSLKLIKRGPGMNGIQIGVADGEKHEKIDEFNAINIHDIIALLQKAAKKWSKYTNGEF